MPRLLSARRHGALAAALLLLATPILSAQDTAHVVLVATTDVHGHATGWDFLAGRPYPGGLTRVGTVVDSLRARYPGEVVLVDAGDLLQGDPFAEYFATVAPRDPTPMVDALNGLGYDAAVPGNHDFNFGVPFFERAVAAARYPVVCANLMTTADSALLPATTVVIRDSVRIAIGGLTTPGSMIWDRANLEGRLRIGRIEAAGPALVRRLRALGDVTVVLIHSGMEGPSSYDTTGVGTEDAAATLAAGAERPDLVVVGHSHREMVDSVRNGVHFVQPRPFARSVAVVHISLARRGDRWTVTRIRGESVRLDGEAESPALQRRLAPARDLMTSWVGQPVGYAAGAFPAAAARAGPTPLMGFVGEAERRAAHADLAAVSAFNTTGGLPAGEIRRSDLFSVYPYENTLRAVRVSGAALRAYLEQSARYYAVAPDGRVTINDSVPGYNFDMIWGADYELDLSRPVGQRVTSLLVRGRPVGPADSFTLAVNSYRQGGGGGFTMLAGAPVTFDGGESVRDILERAAGQDTLHPRDFGRENWRIIPDRAAAQVRALFGLAPLARPAAPTDSVQLRILALGALRGRLDALPTLAAVLDSVGRRCDCPVLRLAPGDLLEGDRTSDLLHGQPAVEGLNRLGLHATAVGVTDLDWSADTLQRRMAGSRFAWLAANLAEVADGARPDWATPYRIVEVGGRRVAVVGLVDGDLAGVPDSFAAGLAVRPPAAAVRDAVALARTEDPAFVVVVTSGDPRPVADALPAGGADAVIGAAGAGVLDTLVNGIPVLGGADGGLAVARVDLVRTVVGDRTWRFAADPVRPDRVAGDTAVAAVLARYAPLAEAAAAATIANAKLPLVRRAHGASLGDLVADAWRTAFRAPVALVADTALHRDLPAGPLPLGAVQELVGRRTLIGVRRWTGVELRAELEEVLASGAPTSAVSGLTVRYDPRAAVGHRVRDVRFPDGSRLRDRDRYSVVTTVPPGSAGAKRAVGALINYLRALPQPVEAPEQPRFLPRS